MNNKNTLPTQHIKLYSQFTNFGILPILFIIAILMLPTVSMALDSDNDGVDDTQDNCIEVANPNQRDSNGDGFGNVCDADLDGNNSVSFADLDLFRSAFGTNNSDADFDGNGSVSFADLDIFRALFGKPPGPAGSGVSISKAEASRFLTQATFGPKSEDIDHLIALGSYKAWIDIQLAASPTLLTPGTHALFLAKRGYSFIAGENGFFDIEGTQHHFIWWNNAIDAEDQLRQRVAFALNEIFVVSNIPIPLQQSQFAMADYYDTLTRGAFGNFRELLEDVSLHSVMGIYLGHVKNEKADPDRNIRPDENYAREVMQLFSIGLHKLNLDGTPQLDADNKPEPAYGQPEVTAFARVFTGWNFAGANWEHSSSDKTLPMEPFEQYHDTDAKILLNGTTLPAGQTARQDLEAAMDNLFEHPNVGPFIGKLLIQRLVTSNPTPDYVARVARVFNGDDGQNARGDLGAVVKAILMDPEARNGHENITGFGKLREPLLRITHLLRTFDATKTENARWNWIVPPGYPVYAIDNQTNFDSRIGQRILRSPSVFNFFLPNYSPPGVVREAGLAAPEFQIVTENTNMAMTNILNNIIFRYPHQLWSTLSLDHESSLASDLDALLQHLNIILLSGGMTNELREILRNHLDNPSFDSVSSGRINELREIHGAPLDDGLLEGEKLRAKVRSAISLIVNSPEYLIQK
jgi:uncharacterized protein (DUF1800 family)